MFATKTGEQNPEDCDMSSDIVCATSPKTHPFFIHYSLRLSLELRIANRRHLLTGILRDTTTGVLGNILYYMVLEPLNNSKEIFC